MALYLVTLAFPIWSLMATVFLPKGRNLWSAKIRICKPSGAIEWRRIRTGCTLKKDAMEVANAAERAVGAPLTQERAERLTRHLLEISGGLAQTDKPSLLTIGNELFDGREANIGESTRRKYASHWRHFQEWAGERMGWPVDRWQATDIRDFYKVLRRELSDTTANNHMTTMFMVFGSARKAGHIQTNPLELVERVSNDSATRHIITREETAKLLRVMRGDLPWRCLTLLGRHTGHRLQDLLSLTSKSASIRKELCTIKFTPQKKRGKGRTVELPLPRYVAKMLKRVGDFQTLNGADNRNGLVSAGFVSWLHRAGIDPLPMKRGARTIHLKSFHSFRHAMASRLVAAGVSGELARLVTDHESAKVHSAYVHAEVESLAGALKLARRK
jgi:site-specific recombinase XerD